MFLAGIIKKIDLKNSISIQFNILILLFFLVCYCGWSLFHRVSSLKVLKEKVTIVEAKLPLLGSIQQRERELQELARKADPLYLEHYLSSMRLARLETYSLETSKDHLSTPQANRLQFLMGPENILHFLSGRIVKSAHMQAVELKQTHPVEVDEKDVQRIIAHIEGTPIGPYAPAESRPPMSIKKFSLTKKQDAPFPSYLLDMELWKRETL